MGIDSVNGHDSRPLALDQYSPEIRDRAMRSINASINDIANILTRLGFDEADNAFVTIATRSAIIEIERRRLKV